MPGADSPPVRVTVRIAPEMTALTSIVHLAHELKCETRSICWPRNPGTLGKPRASRSAVAVWGAAGPLAGRFANVRARGRALTTAPAKEPGTSGRASLP